MGGTVLVCGAGGFIGGHLVSRLKREGYRVCGVDLKWPEFGESEADEFLIADLREREGALRAVDRRFDAVYQLAADMGGAGYVFSGEHDADIMSNSAAINLNVLDACRRRGIREVFYASSACVYPAHNQRDPEAPECGEDSAYPAAPDSEYGWEKLFSERLYLAHNRNHGMANRIARFHNVFGPKGAWRGGREKAPAAICRKVAMAHQDGEIEIWGDGRQTRSFLYVDEAVDAIMRLMASDFCGPVNVGSSEMVSIAGLADMVCDIAGKRLGKRYVPGPTGVRGRNSDNRLIAERLGWRPSAPLRRGLEATYGWVEQQLRRNHG